MRTPEYERILQNMPTDIHGRMGRIVMERPDEYIDKHTISMRLFSKHTSTTDRWMREASEELRKHGFPCLYTSGHAGYYFTVDIDSALASIKEMESRSASLLEQARALRITFAHHRDFNEDDYFERFNQQQSQMQLGI